MKKYLFIISFAIILLFSINIVTSAGFDFLQDFNFNSDSIAILFAFLPIIILFIFSFIAVRSKSRMLGGLQLLFWWLFAVYNLLKFVVWFNNYANIGLISKDFGSFLYSEPSNSQEYNMFIFSMLINGLASLFFAIKNHVLYKMFGGKNNPGA